MPFANSAKILTPLGATLALAALLAAAGCGGDTRQASHQGKEVACSLGSVRVENVPSFVPAAGSLQADQSVMVSTRMMGWVKRIHVTEGQTVAQGDPLLTIDDSDLKAKQAQAEAGLAEARAVLANAEKMAERFENLYAEQAVSKQQLDDVLTGRDRAAAAVKMATAAVQEVKVHLSYLDIKAPTGGVVARKMIEEGNMANPGMPLLILEQAGRMKVVAHVGEKDVSSIKAGDFVTVNVTSLKDAVYEVPLARVIPTANPGSRTYDIEAYLPNPDGRLKSGMFARVNVAVGSRDAILAPSAAIVERGQLKGVWIVDDLDSIVSLRWVRLGHPYGGDIEILAGLSGGESVVLASEPPLAEGDRVVR